LPNAVLFYESNHRTFELLLRAESVFALVALILAARNGFRVQYTWTPNLSHPPNNANVNKGRKQLITRRLFGFSSPFRYCRTLEV